MNQLLEVRDMVCVKYTKQFRKRRFHGFFGENCRFLVTRKEKVGVNFSAYNS